MLLNLKKMFVIRGSWERKNKKIVFLLLFKIIAL